MWYHRQDPSHVNRIIEIAIRSEPTFPHIAIHLLSSYSTMSPGGKPAFLSLDIQLDFSLAWLIG
jgi:hypothetical protein